MNSFIGWIGGKRQLRNEILSHFPAAGVSRYIEVFGGAGWVLFAKEQVPGQMEVYNDLNGDLVNLFRCVKYHCEALQAELNYLPHSREIFFDYIAQRQVRGLTDLQRAARFLYLVKHSFGSSKNRFATDAKSTYNTQKILPEIQKRLKNVVIEQRDFEALLKTYDRPNALFYLDPPYVGTERHYAVQFSDADHQRLAEALKNIKGRFVLSYGDVPLVRELYSWCNIYSTSRTNNLAGAPKNKTYAEVIIRNF